MRIRLQFSSFPVLQQVEDGSLDQKSITESQGAVTSLVYHVLYDNLSYISLSQFSCFCA